MIWNSATNKYVFEEFKESAESAGLQCPAGQYDIGFAQCIDPATGGDDYGCYTHDGSNKSNETTYGLSAGEWAVECSSYGVVKGTALCSSTEGTENVAGTPDESGSGETQYCWCKTTSPAASRWVLRTAFDDAFGCAFSCALGCANGVRNRSGFRSGVFSSIGQ